MEIFRYSHVATLSPVHIAPAQQTNISGINLCMNTRRRCFTTWVTHRISVSRRRRSATGRRVSLLHLSEWSDPRLWPCASKTQTVQSQSSSIKRVDATAALIPTTHLVEAVQVVQLPVLPAPMMHCVLRHRLLRPVEHRRFVHIVPHEQRRRRPLKSARNSVSLILYLKGLARMKQQLCIYYTTTTIYILFFSDIYNIFHIYLLCISPDWSTWSTRLEWPGCWNQGNRTHLWQKFMNGYKEQNAH